MGTYLLLNLRRLLKSPGPALAVIVFPIVVVHAIGVLTNTNQGGIPIGWVDHDQSETSFTVYQRFKAQERLKLFIMEENEAERALRRGDIEAAFVIEEGFQKRIRSGDWKHAIRWLRTERSMLDAYAKERLAAEVMRFVLNSEAAGGLQQRGAAVGWDEAFRYADDFWEPKPLYSVKFKSWSNKRVVEAEKPSLSERGSLAFLFLYAWMIFHGCLQNIYRDRSSGRWERIRLANGALRYYGAHYLSYSLASLIILLLSIWLTGLQAKLSLQGTIALLYLCSTALSFATVFVIRRARWSAVVLTGFALLSFAAGTLTLWGLTGDWEPVAALFPHYWLAKIH